MHYLKITTNGIPTEIKEEQFGEPDTYAVSSTTFKKIMNAPKATFEDDEMFSVRVNRIKALAETFGLDQLFKTETLNFNKQGYMNMQKALIVAFINSTSNQ